MNLKGNTTEFSTHLSRSRMARYLQEQMDTQQKQEVELHLLHCEQCSDNMLQYAQSDAPQHSKQYQKKLKGKLKISEANRQKRLSTTHIKIFRAAAALALLFIFSFFAVKTVMEKNIGGNNSINKAQVKERPADRQPTQQAQDKQEDVSKTEDIKQNHAIAMRRETQKTEQAKSAKEAVETKKVTPEPKEKVATAPALKPVSPKDITTPVVEAAKDVQPETTVQQAKAAPTEEAIAMPMVKPLPKLEKLDTHNAAPTLEVKQESGLPLNNEEQTLLKE